MSTFWSKVKKTESCWIWKGAMRAGGYGSFRYKGKLEMAHRVSYLLTYGDFNKSLHVCHKCDVRNCVNPYHLFLGTRSDNMKDMTIKNRRFVPKGSQHSHAKLDEEKVKLIRLIGKLSDCKELGIVFKVSKETIRKILKNETWKHVI